MYTNEPIVDRLYNAITDKTNGQQQPLRHSVEQALHHYFQHLGDEDAANLYALVLAEVEIPLLKAVLMRTNGNQSKSAQILGINRGTLRKKLKQYNLE